MHKNMRRAKWNQIDFIQIIWLISIFVQFIFGLLHTCTSMLSHMFVVTCSWLDNWPNTVTDWYLKSNVRALIDVQKHVLLLGKITMYYYEEKITILMI